MVAWAFPVGGRIAGADRDSSPVTFAQWAPQIVIGMAQGLGDPPVLPTGMVQAARPSSFRQSDAVRDFD